MEKLVLDFLLSSAWGVLGFFVLPYIVLFYIIYTLKHSIEENTKAIQSLVAISLRDANIDPENVHIRRLLGKED